MSSAREHIEHSYGDGVNQWRIVNAKDQFTLEKDGEHALRVLRVAHLLSNIHTCPTTHSGGLPEYVDDFHNNH
jgi:hypothetical protein